MGSTPAAAVSFCTSDTFYLAVTWKAQVENLELNFPHPLSAVCKIDSRPKLRFCMWLNSVLRCWECLEESVCGLEHFLWLREIFFRISFKSSVTVISSPGGFFLLFFNYFIIFYFVIILLFSLFGLIIYLLACFYYYDDDIFFFFTNP